MEGEINWGIFDKLFERVIYPLEFVAWNSNIEVDVLNIVFQQTASLNNFRIRQTLDGILYENL